MEEEYNWNVILRSSLPIAILMAIVFFMNISNRSKWIYLVLSLIVTYFVIYYQDKKRQNIFTGMALVLLIALIAYGLKRLGLF